MISYLGSLVQFSPAAGRAGHCRQMSLCVGSTRRVLAGQPEVLAASLQVRRAFSLRGERPRQPGACAHSPLAQCAFSLRGPSAGCRSGLRKSSDRNRGLFAMWEGVASLGLSLPPFSSLLPPTSSGDGAVLLWSFSVSVLRTAGGVFQLVNISLLSHSLKKAPSDCSQGLLAGPYPKQCRRLLSVPPPLAGDGCGRLGYFFFWELLLGT